MASIYCNISAAYLPQLFCSGKLVIDSFDCDTDSYWLSSVGYVQFVYCNGDPVVWAHSSVRVSTATHVTVCDVRIYDLADKVYDNVPLVAQMYNIHDGKHSYSQQDNCTQCKGS